MSQPVIKHFLFNGGRDYAVLTVSNWLSPCTVGRMTWGGGASGGYLLNVVGRVEANSAISQLTFTPALFILLSEF